jgi:hypothetical protein
MGSDDTDGRLDDHEPVCADDEVPGGKAMVTVETRSPRHHIGCVCEVRKNNAK